MFDMEHGATALGNSDIGINESFNFVGESSLISILGRRNNLADIKTPYVVGLVDHTPVQIGYAYHIFDGLDIREFPSKTSAVSIESDFIAAIVAGAINDNNGTTVGAQIKYLLLPVPDNGLPEYGSAIGTLGDEEARLTLKLPVSDFEYVFYQGNNTIRDEKDGDTLVLTLEDFIEEDIFTLFIRIGNSYTYLHGRVE